MGGGNQEAPIEVTTMKHDERIRIELTEEQRKQIKDASGREVTVLEFTARELEERLAPGVIFKY
jgi:hypothetical protein